MIGIREGDLTPSMFTQERSGFLTMTSMGDIIDYTNGKAKKPWKTVGKVLASQLPNCPFPRGHATMYENLETGEMVWFHNSDTRK